LSPPKIHYNPINYKLEDTERSPLPTSYAGLVIIRQTLQQLGLLKVMSEIGLKQFGFSDDVVIECLVLLLCAGGRSLSDFEWMRKESGFVRLYGGHVPSVDVLEDYLRRLKMTKVERDKDAAPGQVGYCQAIENLHSLLLSLAYKKKGCPSHLTIDIDAMLIETHKSDATFCYEKYKAYHPFQAYCPELGMVIAHEFRDGNISPAEGHIRLMKRVRALFTGVYFFVRADSAAYQHEFIDYLTTCEPAIGYSITVKQYAEITDLARNEKNYVRLLDKEGIDRGEDYAEISPLFKNTSNEKFTMRSNTRRYYVVRRQQKDPKGESTEEQLSLLTPEYKHTIIVTNAIKEHPRKIILNHRLRFGNIEYFHSQIKGQCGMDVMPSNTFSVNAAYYSLGLLAHNLMRFVQVHLLDEPHQKIEIQTLRFRILRAAAIVINKARSVILRFTEGHPVKQIITKAFDRLATMKLAINETG